MEMTERFRRRPGLPWREDPDAAREALAALTAGEDAGGEGTLLIVERGRVTELNLLGGEIWKLCDGSRDVGATFTLAYRDGTITNKNCDVALYANYFD